jgi:hypothetical protein
MREVKLQSADGGELMAITQLVRDGNQLVIRGKVFGAMPLDARMGPGAARAALKLLTPGLIWFLLTLPFRSEKST